MFSTCMHFLVKFCIPIAHAYCRFVRNFTVNFLSILVILFFTLLTYTTFIVHFLYEKIPPVVTRAVNSITKFWFNGCYVPVDIAIEGKNFRTSALVDTCAVFTVIRRDLYESVACLSPLTPHSTLGMKELQGATGSTIHILGLTSLKINFDNTTSSTTHALVVEGVINYDLVV